VLGIAAAMAITFLSRFFPGLLIAIVMGLSGSESTSSGQTTSF